MFDSCVRLRPATNCFIDSLPLATSYSVAPDFVVTVLTVSPAFGVYDEPVPSQLVWPDGRYAVVEEIGLPSIAKYGDEYGTRTFCSYADREFLVWNDDDLSF